MLPRCFIVCALLLAPSLSRNSSRNVVRFGQNIVLASDQYFHNASCFLCSVTVEGSGSGSVRVFAGNVFLNGPVGGGVLVFGGNVTLTSKASVGSRVVIFGGHLHSDSRGPAPGHTIIPPIIFLPIILLICISIGSLIVVTRRMVRDPVTYPPLPRL